MDEFIDKYKNDKKFRATIKLSLYLIFVVLVTIYAISISASGIYQTEDNPTEEITEENNITEDIIKIPDIYTSKININVNNTTKYTYLINHYNDTEEIMKEVGDITTKYKKENNIYFVNVNGNYLKTTSNEVFDLIDYNYLDLHNINLYLSNAINNNQEYLVYLKDIILNNQTDDYFVILINNKHISIDYTPLMKEINNKIITCQVDITIE